MANNARASLPSEVERYCIDELSRSFGSLSILESHQKKIVSGAAPNLAPNPEDFTPLAGCGSTSITRPTPPMAMPTPAKLSGCRPYGAGVCFLRPKLTNQFLFVNPAQPQESSSGALAGPGMVRGQQKQLFPSGAMGASRGTGVFHPKPRLATVSKNKTIRNKRETKNSKQEEGKVSAELRNCSKVNLNRELEKKQQQEEYRQHLLSEMGLPKEWTY
ncbi:hypothetical protein L6164_033926 [Bauhinia variegata]|uniref:Uncharacterized protein n=1 Tax=Bauhinia variegata TaxID=167791 RepID=A0ACB9KT64_BAUVA|nr:hypothetical protein L6164_033926 [Bauhinia variegata]